MWLVLVLLLKSALSERLIELRQKDLVGEDTWLTMLLKKRTSHDGLQLAQIPLPKQYHENTQLFKMIKESVENNTRRKYRYREPDERAMKERTIEIMQTAIYLTQYRLGHLAEVTKRYSDDIRFRVSYIFSRLDTLLREMRIMFSIQNNTLVYKKRYEEYYRTVHESLLYYTYFLKKNIDVTYIVDHMVKIHTNFTLSQAKALTTTLGPELPGLDSNSTFIPRETTSEGSTTPGPGDK